MPNGRKSVATQIDEAMQRVVRRSAVRHGVEHLFREDERRTVTKTTLSSSPSERQRNSPVEPTEFLRVAEIFAEIDVKQMSRMFDHDVVVVSIADAENVRGHAVRGARIG